MKEPRYISPINILFVYLTYLFLFLSMAFDIFTWDMSRLTLEDYVIRILGYLLVLILSWRRQLIGAIIYLILLELIHSYDYMFSHFDDEFIFLLPAAFLVVAWLVSLWEKRRKSKQSFEAES